MVNADGVVVRGSFLLQLIKNLEALFPIEYLNSHSVNVARPAIS